MAATAGKGSIGPWLGALALCFFLAGVSTGEQVAASGCDAAGGLGLLGFDTASGRVLLVPSSPGPGALGVIEIDLTKRQARALGLRDAQPLFSGSAGPGPIVALSRSGEGHVQAQVWKGATFEPLGDPLAVPPTATLFTTYDRGGSPWIVTHRAATGRWSEASAYRWEKGQWQSKGRHLVQGALAWGVLPAAVPSDAVITGSGLFSANQPAITWIRGFPTLPAGKEGEVAPVGASGAAYFAADGAVYTSPDLGNSWQGSRFRPWGRERSEIWSYGSDYSLDVPLGTLGEPLPLAWFDRRGERDGRIFLTEVSAAGEWKVRGDLSTEVSVEGGEPVELVHLLHKDGGTWILLSDCFELAGRPTVAWVVSSLAGPEPPVFLALPTLP